MVKKGCKGTAIRANNTAFLAFGFNDNQGGKVPGENSFRGNAFGN